MCRQWYKHFVVVSLTSTPLFLGKGAEKHRKREFLENCYVCYSMFITEHAEDSVTMASPKNWKPNYILFFVLHSYYFL